MDTRGALRQSPAMRSVTLLLLACLAGCSGKPSDYGITGPGQAEAPKPREDVLPGGDISMPHATPDTGNGKFWGYN